jgi:hypothetical protein
MSSGIERLQRHVDECDSCRQDSLPICQLDTLLGSSRVDIDAAALSRQAFSAAQLALQAVVLRRFRRQVAIVVTVALAPLPFVLLYDAVLLRLLHAAASSLLSGTMANYIIFMHASLLLFVLAASYAAIPVLVARTMPRPTTLRMS